MKDQRINRFWEKEEEKGLFTFYFEQQPEQKKQKPESKNLRKTKKKKKRHGHQKTPSKRNSLMPDMSRQRQSDKSGKDIFLKQILSNRKINNPHSIHLPPRSTQNTCSEQHNNRLSVLQKQNDFQKMEENKEKKSHNEISYKLIYAKTNLYAGARLQTENNKEEPPSVSRVKLPILKNQNSKYHSKLFSISLEHGRRESVENLYKNSNIYKNLNNILNNHKPDSLTIAKIHPCSLPKNKEKNKNMGEKYRIHF